MTTCEDFVSVWKRRRDEPLDPELMPYLEENEIFGCALKHPLVYQVPFFPSSAFQVNDMYRAKTAAVATAMAEGDWPLVMWLHERPYRVNVVEAARTKLRPRKYWALLSACWRDSENIFEWGDATVRKLFAAKRTYRECLMTQEERIKLADMLPRLSVYRGYKHPWGTKLGWSWTLDKAKAEWFARRFMHPIEVPRVVRGLVARDDVLAYFLARGESEIVADPRTVNVCSVVRVKGK